MSMKSKLGPPYKRPPIVEAVIEIRFLELLPEDKVDKAKKAFLKNYPYCEDRNLVGIHIDPLHQSTHYKNEALGYKMSGNEGSDVLIIATNAFAVSCLAPYPGWDALKARAEKDWRSWKKIVGSHRIQRIGVRYINRIDIPVEPSDKVKLEDYFRFYPNMPDDKLPPLAQYAMQAVISLAEDNFVVVLNSAAVPSPLLKHSSFVLDIDVSRVGDVPQKDIWKISDNMRTHKNHVFESCITDKARVLFSQ